MGEFIKTSNKKLKVFSNTKNGVARCGWPDAYLIMYSLVLWAPSHYQTPNTSKPDSKEPGFFASGIK